MSLTVQAAPIQHWGWLVSRSGCILTADFQAIEAVDARGNIRGMVGYERWSPNSVVLHAAVAAPIVWRALLVPTFAYPFLQTGAGVLLATIPGNNGPCLKMAQALGFREAHRVKDGFRPGVDYVLHEMRRAECRWLRGVSDIKKAS